MGGKVLMRLSTKCLSEFFTMLVVVLFLALSAGASAEEITYTGNREDLLENPSGFISDNSLYLFPGTETPPMSYNNKVTVNYNPSAPGMTHPTFILGGLSHKSENATGNSVVLLDGQNDGDIYGGCYNRNKSEKPLKHRNSADLIPVLPPLKWVVFC